MFQLMLKDTVCAEFNLSDDLAETRISDINIIGTMPINCDERNLLSWLNSRNASKHRRHLSEYLQKLNILNIKGFLVLTHGISINDCYWVRQDSEHICWKDVSPYTNEYDEVIQHLSFSGAGLYGEALSSTSPEFGTSGAFDKCWIRDGSDICLIKRGSDIASNAGLEPYCEVLASQVFSVMRAGIPYRLVNYHSKIASKCRLFNNEQRSFIPYANLGKSNSLYDMLSFYDSLGTDIFRRILVCDALTLNTDRHLGNHGVFCDSETQSIICAAPGYDYNMALCPYLTVDDFADFKTHYTRCMPKIGISFIAVAREVLTPSIRKDLINLKGIKLTLPWYDVRFTEERCEWLSELVNYQIDNILSDGNIKIPTFKVENITNCMKYRIKLGISDEQWVQEVPRLMQIFNIQHMSELEQEIGKLL